METAQLSADDFSDYYLSPPSPRQLEELEALRAAALEHALKAGDALSWQGPNLHPKSLPPTEYPRETPLPSPHGPRPLFSALLARDSPGVGGPAWSLRLLEGIQTGAGQHSQVWRCKVVDGRGLEVGRVVLKLYDQALFPYPHRWSVSKPEHDSFDWWPARHAKARESRAYRCAPPSLHPPYPLCTFPPACADSNLNLAASSPSTRAATSRSATASTSSTCPGGDLLSASSSRISLRT